MNCYNFKRQKGVTLIELIVALAILVIVIGVVFSIFFFGNNTYSSGRDQFDLQSGIRTTADVVRNKLRYASELTVLSSFDPLTMDSNYNYIYLSSDDKSIIYKEGASAAVNLLDVGSSDILLNVAFTKGSISADAIRYSNTIVSASTERTLKYTLSSTDTSTGKIYDLSNEVTLMNVSFVGLAPNVLEGPTVSPEDGFVASGTSVTLSAESGADIYYTLNNTVPTIDSTKYTTPITISSDVTIQAIAVKNGITSSVAVYYYTITDPKPVVSNISVAVVANFTSGDIMRVSFSYQSPINENQGGTIINWYKSGEKTKTSSTGLTLLKSSVLVATDVTTREYIIGVGDKGDYIYVEIIPKDVIGNTGVLIFEIANDNKVKNN